MPAGAAEGHESGLRSMALHGGSDPWQDGIRLSTELFLRICPAQQPKLPGRGFQTEEADGPEDQGRADQSSTRHHDDGRMPSLPSARATRAGHARRGGSSCTIMPHRDARNHTSASRGARGRSVVAAALPVCPKHRRENCEKCTLPVGDDLHSTRRPAACKPVTRGNAREQGLIAGNVAGKSARADPGGGIPNKSAWNRTGGPHRGEMRQQASGTLGRLLWPCPLSYAAARGGFKDNKEPHRSGSCQDLALRNFPDFLFLCLSSPMMGSTSLWAQPKGTVAL